MLTVQELVDDNADKIPFNWIAGQGAADRAILDDGMAAADLVGHLNLIHPRASRCSARKSWRTTPASTCAAACTTWTSC